MSRAIKFRCWSNEEGQYFPIQTINFVDNKPISVGYHKKGHKGFLHMRFPKFFLEQSTGLRDKNGKEIYEGDIVKAKIDGLWQTGAHTVSEGKATWNLEVVYNDIRYMDVFHILGSKNQPNRIYYLFDDSISDIEVIGNIHENPDLLEGKNE